jgi:hypothetical protein
MKTQLRTKKCDGLAPGESPRQCVTDAKGLAKAAPIRHCLLVESREEQQLNKSMNQSVTLCKS